MRKTVCPQCGSDHLSVYNMQQVEDMIAKNLPVQIPFICDECQNIFDVAVRVDKIDEDGVLHVTTLPPDKLIVPDSPILGKDARLLS